MNPYNQFRNIDLTVVEFVANELEKQNIPVERRENGIPDIGPGMYSGQDGFYFRSPSYRYDYDEQEVAKLFPMGVGPYTVFFAGATLMEHDDDRIWPSSIGFTIQHEES